MTSPRRVLWAGERAFLVELSSLAEAMAFRARVVADPLGQVDQIAAARTVLLSFATARDARRAAGRVADIDLTPAGAQGARTIDIDVVYDGEDLSTVALLTGLSPEAVVAAHQATPWTAAFGGFAPGFAYLVGGDQRLQVPRRESPRTAVPAGSVALAGEFSAVYPRRSPGGWQLIGRTDAPLWDLTRADPALIAPGDRVRFRAARASSVAAPVARHGESAEIRPDSQESSESGAIVRISARGDGGAVREGGRGADVTPAAPPVARYGESAEIGPDPEKSSESGAIVRTSARALTVVEPGLLTLIEDLGRPGYSDLGVTASGAADTASAREANRLVGNSRRAAVLETLGGLVMRAEADLVVALAGADPRAELRRRANPADPAPAAGALSADPGPASGALTAAPRSPDPALTTPADPHALRAPEAAPHGAPFLLRAGEELALGYPEVGLRTYVSVRGGIEVPEVLGSRSRDVLGGLGPDPLRAGTTLAIGKDVESAVAAPASPPAPQQDATNSLRIRFGPRDHMFDPSERDHLTQTTWLVGPSTDRVGARLSPADGARPLRTPEGELASEGVVVGALQVPPSGELVLFGADHPVTGGYPVIAVVIDADLPRASQLPPGSRVTFLQIDPESSNSLTVT
ncbi:allophanate hydrolase [Microbacterium sorbitolivorans]|uniref:Urea amidolyase n=1 Tax=Microbacterium sorbitolivorans TaxID=1867410 RepID=A0A367YAJ6_9MICO|nr:carboxyltransferase domain-containing protein [Microbacterium sorbitolivorans]RCK62041.1 urea amidolyase [Microbacterium sorbitolivorans]GGF43638.1 allophanate hydrolase [Microbacterium sorbitolivorans]